MSMITLSFAQEFGTIKGIILKAHDKSTLSDAQITIEELNLGAISDANGNFTLENIPLGKQVIMVSFLGFQTVKKTVEVKSGETIELNILMKYEPIVIEEIIVTADNAGQSSQIDVYSEALTQKTPKDIGEYFKNVTGANAIKKGGFAMDPVIRNFKNDQLNIQYDGGVRCWGGCPNRMDPPTSHVQSEDVEKIEIFKGPFSVRFGQTMGGIVNLVMKKPNVFEQWTLKTSAETGYETNGNGAVARLALKGGDNGYDFYISGGTKNYQNYKTGSGNEVPSGFRVNDYTAKIGYLPAKNHRLQVSWRQSFARDVNYPSLPMDASVDDTDILAFDYSGRNINKLISSITAKVYKTDVRHIMTNEARMNYSAVHAETDATTESFGGRFETALNVVNNGILFAGFDYYKMGREGNRTKEIYKNLCNGMVFSEPKFVTDYVWQNTNLSDAGIFSELDYAYNERLSFNIGGRVDFINSEINDPSPQFTEAYGDISSYDETNFSATVSAHYKASKNLSLNLSLGRGTRSPDISERYINHMPIGMDAFEYFGNPNLKPETNDQIELGLISKWIGFNIKSNVYYSKFNNYITAVLDPTMAKLYLPCMPPAGTKIFQNIENAHQYGFEAKISREIGKGFSFSSGFAYTIAQNEDFDEPLPEVAPMEGSLDLRYTNSEHKYYGEFSSRFVREQDRVADTFSETKTPGFSVFNFQAGIDLFTYFHFSLSVNNIFDKNYYEHLSRKYKNMPNSFYLYEPGRNVILRLRADI